MKEPAQASPSGSAAEPRRIYEQVYWVALPGKEPEKRAAWRSDDRPDELRVDFLELLNEMGGDGWELVSDTVGKTGLNLNYEGWGSSTDVLRRLWTFKRPSSG